MHIRDTIVTLLSEAICRLPEHTVDAIKEVLQKHVGPLVDASEALDETRELADRAEALLEIILQERTLGQTSPVQAHVIDHLLSALKTRREKEGRPKPTRC